MRYLVLGAGMMGSVLARDLVSSKGTEKVVLTDASSDVASWAAEWIGLDKVEAHRLDVTDGSAVSQLMETVDCVVSAVPYRHNAELASLAVRAGAHFCDLGGNNAVVQRELELHKLAEDMEVLVVPNCGLAPGMACVIAMHGYEKMKGADEVHIRVGGLPQNPRPPLNYKLLFSPYGLINEYIERATAIRGGKVVEVDSMDDVEELEFPKPLGALEAFNTSGGTSMLPQMLEGKVRELDYKTIRYPGHCERFRVMLELGFAGQGGIKFRGLETTPRELFAGLLAHSLRDDDMDITLMRVDVRKGERLQRYQMIDHYDKGAGITSMARTTSYPTSIIAQMMAKGEIGRFGAFTPEQCVDGGKLMRELKKRGVVVTKETVSG